MPYPPELCRQNASGFLEGNQNILIAICKANYALKTLTMYACIEDAQSLVFEV